MNNDGKTVWGVPIQYSDHHIPEGELELMRQKVDVLADDCLLALHEKQISVESYIANIGITDVLSYGDVRIQAFATEVLAQPKWLNWELLREGQNIFLKYHGAAALGLFYVSLVGGFGAPKITKVLDATSYMTKHRDATFKRMTETLEMIIDCVDSDGSLRPGSKGFSSVLKVRFLHSRVRLSLLGKLRGFRDWKSTNQHDDNAAGGCPYNQGFHESARIVSQESSSNSVIPPLEISNTVSSSSGNGSSSSSHSSGARAGLSSVTSKDNTAPDKSYTRPVWDSHYYGMPINQEDMMVTLLTFSVEVLRTVERLTFKGTLTRLETDSYLHMWRYIGYLIGVHEDFNPCISKDRAYGVLECTSAHLLKPDKRSGVLARHLLSAAANRPPVPISYAVHSEIARALLGEELSNALGIERNFMGRLYAMFVLNSITVLTYFLQSSSTPDSARIKRVKYLLRLHVNTVLYSGQNDKTTTERKMNREVSVYRWVLSRAAAVTVGVGVVYIARSFTRASIKDLCTSLIC
jgi:ER-bound oxygenase mpaB/B'/Rubber oxygenase, catalytic domain